MATSQMVRPATATKAAWFGMFPNPTTAQTSAVFVKKLVAVAISNITYLRGLFPEYAYADRQLEGLHLKILTDQCTVPAATQIVEWIRGAFEAFDKKYLRQLIVSIYKDKDKPDLSLETYTFSFTYEDESMTITSAQKQSGKQVSQVETTSPTNDIRRTTQQLLRATFQLMQDMSPVPEGMLMSMKLLYYDEVTPEDYEPPGFQKAESPVFEFASKTLNLKTGRVLTPFHSVKLNTRAPKDTFLTDDCREDVMYECQPMDDQQSQCSDVHSSTKDRNVEIINNRMVVTNLPHVENNTNKNSNIEEPEVDIIFLDEPMDYIPSSVPELAKSCSTVWSKSHASSIPCGQSDQVHAHGVPSTQREPMQHVAIPMVSPAHPASAASSVVGSVYEECPTPSDVQNARVRCACGWSDDGGLMIMCFVCQSWQHASCYRMLKESQVPRIFCCIDCHVAGDPDKQCSDPGLVQMEVEKRKELCLYRHALSVCSDIWRISSALLTRELGIPEENANIVLELLDRDQVLRLTKGKGMYRAVNRNHLKNVILPKYFNNCANLEPLEEPANRSVDTSSSPGEKKSIQKKKSKRSLKEIEELNDDSAPNEEKVLRKRQKSSCVKGIEL